MIIDVAERLYVSVHKGKVFSSNVFDIQSIRAFYEYW